jgi:hypothetical protein
VKELGLLNFVHFMGMDGDFWLIITASNYPAINGKTKNDHF